jgi:hypothetical protein
MFLRIVGSCKGRGLAGVGEAAPFSMHLHPQKDEKTKRRKLLQNPRFAQVLACRLQNYCWFAEGQEAASEPKTPGVALCPARRRPRGPPKLPPGSLWAIMPGVMEWCTGEGLSCAHFPETWQIDSAGHTLYVCRTAGGSCQMWTRKLPLFLRPGVCLSFKSTHVT